MFLRTAFLVLRKDLAIEVKSFELVTTTLFFAVGCVVVFAFALVKDGQAPPDSAAAILWISLLFSGTLALGRTFERERYGETIRALLLAPSPRPALYVGKLLGVLCLLGLTELLLVPLIALLFNAPLLPELPMLLLLLVLGTLGFAAVGTLFAAMLMRARTRDVMLPILLYPITIPVIIAGVRGTAALQSVPPDEPTAIMWLSILAAFDVVFVTLSLWTFDPLMTE
jgi:heme exporter protein CcmB